MKTPEKIKKGLAMCQPGADCWQCPYTLYECSKHQMEKDALAYIQQLEAGIDHAEKVARECARSITENLDKLQSRLAQVERERDAAVADVRNAKWFLCHVCKKYYRPDPTVRHYACKALGEFSDFRVNDEEESFIAHCGRFEWRGVCPENTKEEP